MKLSALILIYICGYVNTQVTNKPSVIVIGSGPSGIAAATKLLKNNVTDLVVLEAEDRIGGRINTVHFGDANIDLGAEMCHGEKGNIVFDMVKDLNLLQSYNHNLALFDSQGNMVNQTFAKELYDIFDDVYDGADNAQEGITLGEYFIKQFNKTIYEKYGNNKDQLEFALNNMLDVFHHQAIASEGSFSWYEPSAASDYVTSEGDLGLHWNGMGYKIILDIMMQKYPTLTPSLSIDDKIKLGKLVTQVVWDHNDPNKKAVTVICKDGSRYEADHVIFTPSLGVLKADHKALFNPALPDEKVEAIKRIGFDAVSKVFLHFDKVWWSKDFTGYLFTWNPYQREMLAVEYPYGPKKNGKSWLQDLNGVFLYPKNPNVLLAWITGDMVPEIEKMSDKVLQHGIMFAIDKFLGRTYDLSKSKIDQMIRHGWYKNPNFRGTYSFQTIESRKMPESANLILSKPLLNDHGFPTLLFAGEATSATHHSTVHGAIESGYREADRILKLYLAQLV